MMLLLASVLLAHASDRVVVHTGDTIESIAVAAGDASAAPELRAANGFRPAEQPRPGSILVLPERLAGQSRDAAVLSVHGGAAATVPSVGTVALEAGMPLPEGSRVCTEVDGYATIRLAVSAQGNHHDDITLLPGTCLTIEATVSRSSGRLSLVALNSGSVTVSPLGPGESPGSVAITTDAGLTAAEGGGFRVHVEPEGQRTEALYTGLSVFGGGEEQRLTAGQGSRVPEGGVPTAPVDLLPSGTPLVPASGAVLRRPDFSWVRVDTALGYQFELAASADFREMLLLQEVDRPAWEPDRLLLPGEVEGIWWRVATIDRFGFIGVPSAPRPITLPPGVRP